MDLVSFKVPTHLTWCYQTEGWVNTEGGWNDLKQGKFLALMGVKLPTFLLKLVYNAGYCVQTENTGI
jgi:hypothetical protein